MAGGAPLGNKNAIAWAEEDLQALAEKIAESVAAPECFSLCQIATDCDMLASNLCNVVKNYKVVREAYEKARQILSSRFTELGRSGKGHSAFVMRMIPYYNQQLAQFELDLVDKQEKVKTDHKIRGQKALVEDNKEALSSIISDAAQAIQDRNAKAKKDAASD